MGVLFFTFCEEKYQKKQPQGTPGRGGSLRILPAWGICAQGGANASPPRNAGGTTRLARCALDGGGSFCLVGPTFLTARTVAFWKGVSDRLRPRGLSTEGILWGAFVKDDGGTDEGE